MGEKIREYADEACEHMSRRWSADAPPRPGFAWLAGVMVVVAGVAVAGTGWLRAADGCGHVHIHDELWRLFNVLRARLRSLAGAIEQLFMLFLLSNVASPGQGVAMQMQHGWRHPTPRWLAFRA